MAAHSMLPAGWRAWLLAAAVVVLGAGTGCGGCGTPPKESFFEVAFTSPVEGQELSSNEDVDADSPGIQADIVARARDSEGRVVLVASATLETRLSSTQDFSAGPAAHLVGDTITFSAVPLPPGETVLRVTAVEEGSGREAAQTITLTVKSGRPEVTHIAFDKDTNHDNRINAAELALGRPTATVSYRGMEDGQPVVIRDPANGQVYGQGTGSKGSAQIALTALPDGATLERDFPLVAVLTDKSGHTNQIEAGTVADPRNAPAFVTLRIDRVAPTIDVLEPASVLGPNDDADPATAGFQLRLRVQTSADVPDTGLTVLRTPPGDNVALKSGVPLDTLINGTDATVYTFTVSAVDASGNSSIRTVTSQVKATAPQVLTLRFQNDANNDRILNAAEQPTGAPVAIVTTRNIEDGQTLEIRDSAAPFTLYGSATVTANTATVTLSALPITATTDFTAFVVDAKGTDKFGLAATLPSSFWIDRVAPTLTLVSPVDPNAPLTISDDGDKTAPGFQVHLALDTAADVEANGVQVTTTPGGTVILSPDASHRVTFDGTVPEIGVTEVALSVTAVDFAKNATQKSYTLKLGDVGSPAPGFFSNVRFNDSWNYGFGTSHVVGVAGAKRIVAQTNVGFYEGITSLDGVPADLVADLDPNTPGAQVQISAQVRGGMGTQARVLFEGTDVCTPVAIATNGVTPVNLTCTLPIKATGALVFKASKGDGSEATYSTTAIIDADPPSASSATLALVTSGTGFSDRKPGIDVTWAASNDDGSTGSGTPAGFSVKWSTDAVVSDLVATDPKRGIEDELSFSGTDGTLAKAATSGLLPANATTTRITGLPAFGTYYVQVRAKDAAGNLAPLVTTVCPAPPGIVGPGCVEHPLNVATLNNPGTASFFGYYMRAGDFNGDGKSDLVILDNGTPTEAFVAYGNTDMSQFAAVPLSNRISYPTSSLGPTVVPSDASIGNASHATPSALRDLAIADPSWASNRGRYFLFFGRATTLDPTPVEFRGLGANSNVAAAGFATERGYIKILPDFGRPGGGGPDGLDEVVITANAENSGNGRVYLFYGRPHDAGGTAGSWEALRVSTDGDGLSFIPMASADRIFSGDAPPACAGCVGAPAPAGAMFGVRRGYASLGDITGDGVPDFVVPAARDFVNRLYLFSGALVNAGGPSATLPNISPNDVIQRLSGAEPSAPNGAINGLGSDALGNVNVVGNASRDLIVGNPANSTVSIYADATSSGFAGAPRVITGGTRFGDVLSIGDLDQDGRQDLVVGTNAIAPGPTGTVQAGWVLYNTGVVGAEFDASVTRFRGGQRFHQSRLSKPATDTDASSALGRSVAVGDFNGDGVADVAVSDHRVGPAATPGRIYVRY